MIPALARFLLACGIWIAIPLVSWAVESEKDIPVQIKSAHIQAKSEDPMARLVGAFIVVSLMGIAATLWVRKMKMKQGHRDTAPSIKMLNQLHLSPKKSIALIRVAGESILIGVTDQNISHLKTLSLLDEELPELSPQDFRKLVANPEASSASTTSSSPPSVAESTSMGVDLEVLSIRDRVSEKLKNLKVLG